MIFHRNLVIFVTKSSDVPKKYRISLKFRFVFMFVFGI